MKRLVFPLVLFFLFAVWACQSKKMYYQTDIAKNISLNVPEGSNKVWGIQYREVSDKKILTVYFKGKHLINYNFNTGKIIDSISVPDISGRKLFGFNYHNDDSIFLFYRPPMNMRHDSSFLMINRNSEILKNYSFKAAPLPFGPDHKPSYSDLMACMQFSNFQANSDYGFFGFCNAHPEFVKTLKEKKIPAGGHIDIANNVFETHPVMLPYPGNDSVFPNDYSFPYYAANKKNELVYGFKYFDTVYHYSVEKQQLKKSRMPFSRLKSSYNFLSEYEANDYHFISQYKYIYFNPYKNQYIRIADYKKQGEKLPKAIKNKTVRLFAVFDENFKKSGEGIIPYKQSLSSVFPLFTPEGMWLLNFTEMKDKPNRVVYSLISLKKTNDDISQEIEKVYSGITPAEKEGLVPYLKKQGIDTHSGAAVLIPVNTSCKSCASYAAEFFKNNDSFCKKEHVSLVLIGNKKSLKQFAETNNIKPGENIYTDYSNLYSKYLDLLFKPTLFVYKNDSVYFSKGYKPDNIYQISQDVKANLKKE